MINRSLMLQMPSTSAINFDINFKKQLKVQKMNYMFVYYQYPGSYTKYQPYKVILAPDYDLSQGSGRPQQRARPHHLATPTPHRAHHPPSEVSGQPTGDSGGVSVSVNTTRACP